MGWRVIRVAFGVVVLALCLGFVFVVTTGSRASHDGDTQVVAQWRDEVSDVGLFTLLIAEFRIDQACGDMCAFKGSDGGSGTHNIYVYTGDVRRTVDMLVALERAGDIPKGLRIGVQHFENARHDDWTYDPVYPPDLDDFDTDYSDGPDSSP